MGNAEAGQLAGVALQKTAVVVVHGIGEQRPLDTLLGFVGDNTGCLGLTDESDRAAYVNPDVISEGTYLRRVTVDARGTADRAENLSAIEQVEAPRVVDFFEYYWAYAFRRTSWRHVGSWLASLLRARRGNISPVLADVPGPPKAPSVLRGSENNCFRRILSITVGVLLALALLVGVALVGPWPTWLLGNALPSAVMWLLLIGCCVGVIVAMNPLGLISVMRISLASIVVALLIALIGLADWSKLDQSQRIATALGLMMLCTVVAYAWWNARSPAAGTHTPAPRRRLGGTTLPLIIGLTLLAIVVWALWAPLRPGAVLLAAIVPSLTTVGAALTGGVMLRGVGDAARYLSNGPDDINERERIRTGLVKVLHRLHERCDPVTGLYIYDRVVIVGHSLGSVIAFDAIQAYWMTVSRNISLPSDRAQAVDPGQDSPAAPSSQCDDPDADARRFARIFEQARRSVIDSLESQLHPCPKTAESPGGPYSLAAVSASDGWLTAQRAFQVMLRWRDTTVNDVTDQPADRHVRWIVTDFVTVGSPLAHAELLLAADRSDLRHRMRRSLLAANPPVYSATRSVGDHEVPVLRWPVSTYHSPNDRTTRMFSAAQFAAVTWTNIYFENDLVGGPLVQIFGNGVRDVKLPEAAPYLLNFALRYSHSSYWPGPRDRPGGPGDAQHPVGTLGSRLVLREMLLTPDPVLWISGTAANFKAFQELLYLRRPSHPSATAKNRVEIRLLLRADNDGPPIAWLWPGPSPIATHEDAEQLALEATTAGLFVVLAGDARQTA
jgi:hypothetical protein